MAENDMNLINQYQLFQQQLQSILIQREDTKLELMENEKALEQLKNENVKEAYKISGQIMVKKDVESIKKDIEDRISELEL
ncbi:MAG: prefoldin subunit, partial [Candidatus Aenigmatarchaeota archaeon]